MLFNFPLYEVCGCAHSIYENVFNHSLDFDVFDLEQATTQIDQMKQNSQNKNEDLWRLYLIIRCTLIGSA